MRHILPVLLLAFCQPLIAQIDKGSTLLGGSFGYNSSLSNSLGNITSQNNSNLRPFIQFGYKPNRTIGFALDFQYSVQKSDEGLGGKSESFGIGPSVVFTQYHPLKGNFGWWLNQYVDFSHVTFKTTNNTTGETTKSDNSVLGGGITPGIYYVAGAQKNWLLQASVGGISARQTWYNNSNNTNFTVGSNIFQSFNFGFAYIFNRNKTI